MFCPPADLLHVYTSPRAYTTQAHEHLLTFGALSASAVAVAVKAAAGAAVDAPSNVGVVALPAAAEEGVKEGALGLKEKEGALPPKDGAAPPVPAVLRPENPANAPPPPPIVLPVPFEPAPDALPSCCGSCKNTKRL